MEGQKVVDSPVLYSRALIYFTRLSEAGTLPFFQSGLYLYYLSING